MLFTFHNARDGVLRCNDNGGDDATVSRVLVIQASSYREASRALASWFWAGARRHDNGTRGRDSESGLTLARLSVLWEPHIVTPMPATYRACQKERDERRERYASERWPTPGYATIPGMSDR